MARLATVALLGLVVLVYPLPGSMYTLLRIIVCATSTWGATVMTRLGRIGWAWAFGLTALVFNPVFPLYLGRGTWVVVDAVAGAMVLLSFAVRDSARSQGEDLLARSRRIHED